MHTHIWTPEQHQSWQLLANRQLANATGKVSQRFFKGLSELALPLDHAPNISDINTKLTPLTGWHLIHTDDEYVEGREWFKTLQTGHFFVTKYIRPANSLDYTPKPDAFHDIFGHVAFLADHQINRIIRRFTDLIVKANPQDRIRLGHMWWYTIEFGLVKEAGEIRAFGAGLASSFGELNNAFSGDIVLKPFTVEEVGSFQESPTQYHTQFFVLESLDSLEEILANWPLK